MISPKFSNILIEIIRRYSIVFLHCILGSEVDVYSGVRSNSGSVQLDLSYLRFVNQLPVVGMHRIMILPDIRFRPDAG
jgi:hypothetical protein